MLPVLSAEAMRSADTATIESFGIPGFTLMETAGRSVAQAVTRKLNSLRVGSARKIICVCGTGNNGGDGFVAARALFEAGYSVQVIVVGNEDRMPPDAAHNFRLVRKCAAGQEFEPTNAALRNTIVISDDGLDPDAPIIVDALLGTGIRGGAREPAAAWINRMNAHPAAKISVDVPSGLDTDTGRAPGPTVRAETTVTFGALKTGLLFNDGPRLAGSTVVVDIGIPGKILRSRTSGSQCANLVTRSDITIPVRAANAHKYSAGALIAVCGSEGLNGAAIMSALAAMRTGAGAVTVASGKSTATSISTRIPEAMTLPLPESNADLIPEDAATSLSTIVGRARALLIGCGLGRKPGAIASVREILRRDELPAVVDADGLFALGSDADKLLSQRQQPTVLTPHRGEFERLLGSECNWDDRIELARSFAHRSNSVVVLKGLPSVVGTPDGRAFIAPSVSSALATAGAGDVLAGMIGGLVAQGMNADRAAITALYIGGLCAERFASTNAPQSMMATDILELLPTVLGELQNA